MKAAEMNPAAFVVNYKFRTGLSLDKTIDKVFKIFLSS